MVKYVVGRLFAMVITLYIIVTLCFMVLRLMPGTLFGYDPQVPPAVRAAIDARYHLDRPIIVQYGFFIRGLVLEGDWGTSISVRPTIPAFEVLRDRIPISMQLNIYALLISIPLGVIFGTWAALKRNKMTDHVLSIFVVVCISIPSFVFASMTQYLLASRLGWFPIIFRPTAEGAESFTQFILPVFCLAIGPIAIVARYLRSELIENLNSDYMLLARTKGLTRTQATVRHCFRNSCVPLVNIIVGMFAGILGGSLVIENIFAIPGVGNIMLMSINASDHPLTIAILIFYSVIGLMSLLIIDILYGVVDPRIRMGSGK